jgi:Tol biopolymer transport system component
MKADGTGIQALAESFDVRGGASWSPDGKWIAVAADQGDGTRIFKVPVDGGEPLRLMDRLSYNPVWSPDGRFIVYSEQQGGGQFAVRAITPDRVPVAMPDIQVNYTTATPYRFMPNSRVLVYLEPASPRQQDFFSVDLDTGQQHQLTQLKPGTATQNFDISSDGKRIIFDRLLENSDIVVMDLRN